MSILQAGYREQLPDHIKNRVVPTNLVALLVIFSIGIPFTFLTPIYFSYSLTIIPILGTLTCVGVILFNKLGYIQYSRIPLSLVPVTTGFFYNMLLCGPLDDPIPSVYLITLGFSLIPFVTLDIREWPFLLFCGIYSFLILIGFPVTRHWATLAVDSSILRNGWLSHLTVGLGTIMTMGCMLGLSFIGRNMMKQSEQLREVAEQENEKLIAQQRENEEKTRELEQAREEEKKRQWVNGGVTQMIEILRQANNMNEAYDKAVSGIVKYLGANQAGLFIVERQEEQITINLKSCYAYERKKFLNKSIAPGEGLLGQTFLEQATMRLTRANASNDKHLFEVVIIKRSTVSSFLFAQLIFHLGNSLQGDFT